MKLLPLLKIHYENKPVPTTEELIGYCDRYFPHWLITRTDAESIIAELHRTAKGPGPRTVFSLIGGGR